MYLLDEKNIKTLMFSIMLLTPKFDYCCQKVIVIKVITLSGFKEKSNILDATLWTSWTYAGRLIGKSVKS